MAFFLPYSPSPMNDVIEARAMRVMGAGVASMVLTVGLARFLYTPLLPVMQAQAGLSTVDGGWLATVNYAGYMTGTLLAASVGDLRAKFRLYRVLLVVAVVTTICMGFTTSVPAWIVLRFMSGVSSVAALLLASGLMMNWLLRHGRRPELGVHFAGIGVGIALSGVLAVAMAGRLDWADQWIVGGSIGILLLIPAWIWMPMPPPDDGVHRPAMADRPPTRIWLGLFTAAYFCAGAGYVVSATFIVAIAARQPALHGLGNLVWVVVGLAAIPASPLWDRLARSIGDRTALLAAFAMLTVSILIAAATGGLAASLVSAALYGGSFNGITGMTLSIVGRLYPRNPSKAMARMTISFGAAQIVAPAISGYIAALTGSYRGALYMTAVTMIVGMGFLMAMGSADRRGRPQGTLPA